MKTEARCSLFAYDGCGRSGVGSGVMRSLRKALLAIWLLVHVSVAQEPSLTVMPESLLRPLGEGAYVSCIANVDDPELVTEMAWLGPNGEEIPNRDGTISTFDEYSGPGKLNLIIEKLREQDSGIYNCTATYAGNQKLWASFEVQSYIEIDFGDTPDHQTPIIGEEYKIRCTPSAKPAPQVDWLKDLVSLKNDDNHIIQQDGILIKNVTEADEGVYRCRARVPELGALEYRDIQVTVYIPPSIDNPPEDINGVEKESVTFHCEASGKPAPTYSWVNKDNEPLEDLDDYVVDNEKGILTIMDLRPEHSGTYRCTAESPAGKDFKTAMLRVLTKPKVEKYLNITQAVETEAELQCIASGDPAPQIIFQKETNDSPFQNGINQDDRIEVQQQRTEEGYEMGILKIRGVVRSDDGLYSCTAKSEGGETQAWGHITVEFKPSFEEQPYKEIWSWEQEPVNLTCLATSIPNATIQWYLRNQEIDANDPNLKVLSLGPLGVLRVNPISNSYFGDYTCQATNPLGKAEWDLKLKEAHVPGPISDAKKEKITATTITWSIIDPVDDGGLPIQGYVVEYHLQGQNWIDAESRFWTKGSSYTLDGLRPQETYVFRFAARSEAGDGEWGGEKSELMPRRAAPEEPLIFGVDNGVKEIPYPDQYILQWQVPLDNGEKIDFFQITHYQVHNVSGKWETAGSKKTTEVEYPGLTTHTIESLHSNSHYKIELRAHNNIGFSTPAEAIIKTANGPNPKETSDPGLGIGIIIAIVVIAVIVTVVVVDVACFFTRSAGLTAAIIGKRGVKDKDKEAMLEDGKNASDEKHEGNGQMKPQNEEPKQEQPESDEKIKDSTEPTETTPMIQGQILHKRIQGTEISYQDVLHHEKQPPCIQNHNNVDLQEMWKSENQTSHNLDPVCSESFFIHEKTMNKTLAKEPINMKSFSNEKASEQSGHGLSCHPHKMGTAVKNKDNLIKNHNSIPILEQSSSDDSIYAVVLPDQCTQRQDALADYPCPRDKPTPPPLPPPRRNPPTNLTFGKLAKSQEVLSVKHQNQPKVMNHKTQTNTFTNSPSLHNRKVAQHITSMGSLNRAQKPLVISKSRELLYQEPNPYLLESKEKIKWGLSNHFVPLSSEMLNQGPSPYYISLSKEALNCGQYSPYFMSQSREAINWEQNPCMSISKEALNLEQSHNYLLASREPKNLGQSPSMSASNEVLNLEKIPRMPISVEAINQGPRRFCASASKKEVNQEFGPFPKFSSREAVKEPKSPYITDNIKSLKEGTKDTNHKFGSKETQNRIRNMQDLNTPTRSPSESSSVTLYQPLNTTQTQAETRVAYGVAPYDAPLGGHTDKGLNTSGLAQKLKVPASSHPSSSLFSAVSCGSKTPLNRTAVPQPKTPVTFSSKPSLLPMPSELPSPVSVASKHREKRKSLTTTTVVYFRDNPQHPSHTQSMDHLDGLHTSSPTAGQISSITPTSISSAKSLGSLIESSSSLRSYNQPTII